VSVRLFGQLKISLLDLDFLGGVGGAVGAVGGAVFVVGANTHTHTRTPAITML